MPIVGVDCIRGKVSMEDHIECSINERPCGIDQSVLGVITRPTIEREFMGVRYSPSSIQGCHRQYALKRDYAWHIPVDDAYPSARGTIMHGGLANLGCPAGALGVLRELRLFAPIMTRYGEQPFSGQIDQILLMRIEEGTLYVRLTDFKTKNDVPNNLIEPEKRHLYQINFYRWLVTQVLLEYLKEFDARRNPSAVLHWGDGQDVSLLHSITAVVVEELNISYMAMSKQRTFTSSRIITTRGKIRGETGEDGKWHQLHPREYEDLELAPLHMFSLSYSERLIREGIERQIEGGQELAAPLIGEDAQLMCPRCPVKEDCITLGKAQGLDMRWQER